MDRDTVIRKGTAGRHETFSPRYGWLKKGFDCCCAEPHVFNDDDAIEKLGVGKNMVQSIRFWCLLFRLLEEPAGEAGLPKGSLVPSEFGRHLLDSANGWDPFLEDTATLWLLHWQVFVPPFLAVSWPLAFSGCSLASFDHKELTAVVASGAAKREGLRHIAAGSLDRDASCIIRMYAPADPNESEIRCPFGELGLIEPTADRGRFRFVAGPKQGLPALVFLAACLSYSEVVQPSARSISLSQIANGETSPGVAFRMSETDCGRALHAAAEQMRGVFFVESEGVRQLQFGEPPETLYLRCLETYYAGGADRCV